MIGYDRYEGRRAWNTLCKLYLELRLYVNFFQPSLKLLNKKRDGAKLTKRYEPARTPYQRVLDSGVDSKIKNRLSSQYQGLDAVKLLGNINALQKELQKLAVGEFQIVNPVEPQLFYHKQAKRDGRKGLRNWRTRKDPFEKVMTEIDQLLENDPYRSAANVLRELMDRHPEQFRSGQLRSMQRRVIDWRQQNPERLKTLKHAMLQ